MGLLWLSACYVRTPAPALLNTGQNVALELNDAGRVALADRLGPEIDMIEGTVVSLDTTRIRVAVTSVRTIRGIRSHWTGEQVSVDRDHIRTASERRLSRGRTAIAVGGVLGALALAVTQFELFGFGSDREGGDPIPPPVDQ